MHNPRRSFHGLLSFYSLFIILSVLFHARNSGATTIDARRTGCKAFSTYSWRAEASAFVSLFSPDTYRITDGGLEMYLNRPQGEVRKNGSTNTALGNGATLNSTFTLLYGKVTFEMRAATVSGCVTAAILIGDNSADEMDVELLGGEPNKWQSNVFAPQPGEQGPIYGVLGQLHTLDSSIGDVHRYSIDWNAERIIWTVNDRHIRTLTPDQTIINGKMHYPSHPCRVQLGLWDASSPAGTSAWAKGPIDWKSAPSPIVSTVHAVEVECY